MCKLMKSHKLNMPMWSTSRSNKQQVIPIPWPLPSTPSLAVATFPRSNHCPDFYPCRWVWHISELHTDGPMQYVLEYVCFFSFNTLCVRFICDVVCSSSEFTVITFHKQLLKNTCGKKSEVHIYPSSRSWSLPSPVRQCYSELFIWWTSEWFFKFE